MSRPFSYNDENFTVIGNVLFVHFKYENGAEVGQRLIEIPPAIYDRLLFYTNVGALCYPVNGRAAGVVTLTAASKGKLIIDGTLDIECNY